MAKLKKELSLPILVLYGVGIILGAGIYVLIGKGAGIVGDSLWISFVLAAIIASFTGLSYAELSGMFPKTAAEYVYTKRAFKKQSIAFLAQWIMIFSLIVASSTVALGFGSYLSFITGISPIIGAAALLILLSVISYIGIKESAKFNIIGTIVEMSGLIIVIIIGMFFIGSTDANFFEMPAEGWTSVLMATSLIFFAYIGFEDLVNLSEESKNSAKIMPRALILSLVISTILYILVSISSVAILGSEALAASSAPITEVVSAAIPQANILMSVIALFATANTVLAMLVVLSRMLYGLSCNGAFPSAFCKIGKRKTPYFSVVIVLICTLAFLSFGNIETIAFLTDIGIFLVYFFVNSSLIILRYREPDTPRTFRSPLNIGKFPVLALLGILSAGLMLFHFDPILILYEIIIAFAGLLFYFAFSKIKEKKQEKYIPLMRKSVLTSPNIEKVLTYPKDVSTVMTKNVISVKPNDSALKAAQLINQNNVGSVVVIENSKPVGIITEGDILRRLFSGGKRPGKVKCRNIMSSNLIVIRYSESTIKAIDLMRKKNIKKLIVKKNGKIEGIVTASDIIRSGHAIPYQDLKKLSKIVPVYKPKK